MRDYIYCPLRDYVFTLHPIGE